MSTANLEVVNRTINTVFSNTLENDVALYPASSNQSIHLGCATGSNSAIKITSSNVEISRPINSVANNYAFFFTAVAAANFVGNVLPFSSANSSYPYTTITGYGFQAPVKGLYFISTTVNLDNGTYTQWRAGVYRSANLSVTTLTPSAYNTETNIVLPLHFEFGTSTSHTLSTSSSGVIFCNAGDYIRVFATPSTAGTLRTYSWGAYNNVLTGYLISQMN